MPNNKPSRERLFKVYVYRKVILGEKDANRSILPNSAASVELVRPAVLESSKTQAVKTPQ